MTYTQNAKQGHSTDIYCFYMNLFKMTKLTQTPSVGVPKWRFCGLVNFWQTHDAQMHRIESICNIFRPAAILPVH